MTVGLDYDDTYTQDPELWEQFIALCQSRGHRVVMVTKREPSTPVSIRAQIEVLYTSRGPKRHLLPAGTVWVDDSPWHVLFHDDNVEAGLHERFCG